MASVEKLAANIILETFSLKSGTRQGYLLYTSIHYLALEVLVKAIKQDKE